MMETRAFITLVLWGSVFGGCAFSHTADEVMLREALQEREAAYAQVAKAITRYCSVVTHSLKAREACILERQFSLLRREDPPIVSRNMTRPMDFTVSD